MLRPQAPLLERHARASTVSVADHGLLQEHERNAAQLDPHAVICIHRALQRLVETAYGVVHGPLHAEAVAARKGEVRRVPQLLESVFLRMVHPGLVERPSVEATRDEIVRGEGVSHRRHPARGHLVVGIAERGGQARWRPERRHCGRSSTHAGRMSRPTARGSVALPVTVRAKLGCHAVEVNRRHHPVDLVHLPGTAPNGRLMRRISRVNC